MFNTVESSVLVDFSKKFIISLM